MDFELEKMILTESYASTNNEHFLDEVKVINEFEAYDLSENNCHNFILYILSHYFDNHANISNINENNPTKYHYSFEDDSEGCGYDFKITILKTINPNIVNEFSPRFSIVLTVHIKDTYFTAEFKFHYNVNNKLYYYPSFVFIAYNDFGHYLCGLITNKVHQIVDKLNKDVVYVLTAQYIEDGYSLGAFSSVEEANKCIKKVYDENTLSEDFSDTNDHVKVDGGFGWDVHLYLRRYHLDYLEKFDNFPKP